MRQRRQTLRLMSARRHLAIERNASYASHQDDQPGRSQAGAVYDIACALDPKREADHHCMATTCKC